VTTQKHWTETELLLDLEPVVAGELERHLKLAQEWMPHQYVPWSEGRDYDGPLDGEAWSEQDTDLPEAARTALVVNLLTEDNLPSYHHEIATLFGRDGAWGTWVHRWTAEEGRHSIAIRDYLTVTRAVDPDSLERARMTHMEAGFQNVHEDAMLHSLAYVSFQELATRISHRNTGRATGDPRCEALLARISTDENLHMVFYRNMLAAALERAPSQTMRAVTDVVTAFQMPGSTIEGFARKSAEIANAGIYDIRQHLDEVLRPVLRQWKVWDVEGLDADGETAREELDAYLDKVETAAQRFEARRAARREREAGAGAS
jgi:acyl-[acyl-carrier-protein] desaturase